MSNQMSNRKAGSLPRPGNTTLEQQLDPALVQQALALIEPAQRIALLAHEHPDGDCIGSALGLAHILQETGKTCVPMCADPAPGTLAFLPGLEMLRQTPGAEHFDLIIALDAGELSRFGPLYEQHRALLDTIPILNIDHHISSAGCGQVNIIDAGAAATAELLVLFQQQAHLPLSRDAALCLLTGVITDTSSFQFTNTTPRTLEAAAVLLRAGAIPETVVQPLYRTRPLPQERFRAMVLLNAQSVANGRLLWSQATTETLAAAGATAEMDDNFSGMLRDIEGVEMGAFFKSYDDPAITRLSLRCAAPYNAAAICQSLGQGGGHERAAGVMLPMPIAEATTLVVSRLEQILMDTQ
ncbi:MAG: bifunctional oligoribonuclease/PAP phosphatase NrnA [Ktedonobacteraceae bacterium]